MRPHHLFHRLRRLALLAKEQVVGRRKRMTTTKEKLENLKKLTNKKGVIACAAMDQRGSLKKSIAKAKGVDPKEITKEQMAEFKTAVTKVLSPYASGILLDPEYGLPATTARANTCGLLLAYEKSGYDNTQPGRFPDLLKDWSPRKIKEAGANAVKILLYYTPFEKKEINEKKHEWVEAIGKECTEADIPFFLEFVGYPTDENDEKSLGYAKIKPQVVAKSMEEFSKPRYNVDVLKVEIPVNMEYVGPGKAYTKKEAIEHFRKAAATTTKPFIYLSAGVDDNVFRASLELACESGVKFNGILCGRATWKEGIPVYAKSGVKALEAWLSDRGVQNIQALNTILDRGATPL